MRAGRAFVLVVATVLTVCAALGSGVAAVGPAGQSDAPLASADIVSHAASGVDLDVASVLAAGDLVPVSATDVPSWFAEEVVALPEGTACAASEDWSLVGIIRHGDAEDATGWLREELAARGWSEQTGTGSLSQSYMRSEGRCRWLAATCVQEGDATSIVLHIQHV